MLKPKFIQRKNKKEMTTSLLIVTLEVNFYSILLVSVIKEPAEELVGFLFIEQESFPNGIMGILNVMWRYFNMNIAMFSHFVPTIISSGRSLFCSSIIAILLSLVVSRRMWLIKLLIMLSVILLITLWFPFTKAMCLWRFYIYANWWKMFYWLLA